MSDVRRDAHTNPRDAALALEAGRAVIQALDPLHDVSGEELQARIWRFEELFDAGYDVEDALAMARSRDVDLEEARALVSRHHCPPALAARILL